MSGTIDMPMWHAILLGIVEGVTEFLPVSSTGHLTIMEKVLGYSIDNPDITAFTAIIQSGAVLATALYLRRDLVRLIRALLVGVAKREERRTKDFLFACAVILGSVPIAIVGLTFKDSIETTLRSLWVVGTSLILWSAVMWFADRKGSQARHEEDVTWKDTLIIGVVQCLSLIPGVSRSGATMSAGLLRGIDRVSVTRLSFFLSIPALFAAAILQTVTEFGNISDGVGWGPTITATVVSFVVAYVAIAWLLRFIAKHTYSAFIIYRVILGIVVLTLVATNTITAV